MVCKYKIFKINEKYRDLRISYSQQSGTRVEYKDIEAIDMLKELLLTPDFEEMDLKNGIFLNHDIKIEELYAENRRLNSQYEKLKDENSILENQNNILRLDLQNIKSSSFKKEDFEALEIKNKRLQEEIEELKKELPDYKDKHTQYLEKKELVENNFNQLAKELFEYKKNVVEYEYGGQLRAVIDLLGKINDNIGFYQNKDSEVVEHCLKPLKKDLLKIIKEIGIKEIKAHPGEIFDRNYHQTKESINYEATVIQCLEPGFMFEKIVLKKALVDVKEREEF